MPSLYELTSEFLSQEDAVSIERQLPSMAERYISNPYSILEMKKAEDEPYITFPELDKHIILDTFQKRLYEMKAAIMFILNRNEDNGNSWMPFEDFNKEIHTLLQYTGHPLFRGNVKAYLNYYRDIFYYDEKKMQVGYHITRKKEWLIYQKVLAAKQATCRYSRFIPIDQTEILSEDQITSAKNIVRCGGNISILIGGPGTGKSTTIKSIISGVQQEYPGAKIAILAPTGKATKRVRKEFNSFEFDEFFQIETIHRFVGFGKDFLTKEDRKEIRSTDIIIIDESSMIPVDIFEQLLNLVNPEYTKLILVGDVAQLPAIGVGNILYDLIKLKVYTEKLIVNYRSNAPIIKNAKRIEDNNPFPDISDNYTIIDCPKMFINELLSLYKTEDSTILSPYRKEDRFGNTSQLNRTIQVKKYGTYTQFSNRFNIGDHVILVKTNYKAGYYNGDTGVLVGYDRMYDGYVVQIGDDDDLDEDKKTVVVTSDDEIELAYAITIHKSQGSEYPFVDIIIPEYNDFITKKVLYTAVTRAKSAVRIWTTMEIYRKIVLNDAPPRRTFLSSWAA